MTPDIPPPHDVEVSMTVGYRDLCGLFALMNWIEGLEVKNGKVPGNFELIMLYRRMCDSKKAEEKNSHNGREVSVGEG